jgi:hypothetical protein
MVARTPYRINPPRSATASRTPAPAILSTIIIPDTASILLLETLCFILPHFDTHIDRIIAVAIQCLLILSQKCVTISGHDRQFLH